MQSQIKFGLYSKSEKKILGISTHASNSEDSSDIYYEIGVAEENQWLVDYAEHAEYVRLNGKNQKWYNAGYETPILHGNPDDLVVVKVVMTYEQTQVAIPTPKEFAQLKYGETDPNYLAYIKKMEGEGNPAIFSWWDYKIYLKLFKK